MIGFTEYFHTSWRPVHWSGSRTIRTEMIPWILCLIIYLISHSGLDVASIILIINNQIKYTGIFWSLILDLQAILIADTYRIYSSLRLEHVNELLPVDGCSSQISWLSLSVRIESPTCRFLYYTYVLFPVFCCVELSKLHLRYIMLYRNPPPFGRFCCLP